MATSDISSAVHSHATTPEGQEEGIYQILTPESRQARPYSITHFVGCHRQSLGKSATLMLARCEAYRLPL